MLSAWFKSTPLKAHSLGLSEQPLRLPVFRKEALNHPDARAIINIFAIPPICENGNMKLRAIVENEAVKAIPDVTIVKCDVLSKPGARPAMLTKDIP